MPTWLRRFHIQKINEHHKKEKEEYDKVNPKKSNSKVDRGPNITPYSNYNFKK